jgi:hypothetical protein
MVQLDTVNNPSKKFFSPLLIAKRGRRRLLMRHWCYFFIHVIVLGLLRVITAKGQFWAPENDDFRQCHGQKSIMHVTHRNSSFFIGNLIVAGNFWNVRIEILNKQEALAFSNGESMNCEGLGLWQANRSSCSARAARVQRDMAAEAAYDLLKAKADPLHKRAIIRSKENGAWLTPYPSYMNRTELSQDEFQDNLKLRFSSPPRSTSLLTVMDVVNASCKVSVQNLLFWLSRVVPDALFMAVGICCRIHVIRRDLCTCFFLISK